MGLDLQKEILKDLGAQLEESFQEAFLFDIYKDEWHLVSIDLVNNTRAADIIYWIDYNCTDSHIQKGREFLFKNETDAIMFALKWS